MNKAARIFYHVYLMLTLFGMVVGVLYFLLMRNDFLTQYPDMEAYYPQYVAAAALTGLGAIGSLRNQRWGVWAMILGMVGAFGIELITGVPWYQMARIPISMAALLLLMRWNKLI
ncbi:MAG TPA: hypothetical protein DCF33_17600 [Saprospirales bacterium]|nr:hypothetical protein [Saprospirales bacterium]